MSNMELKFGLAVLCLGVGLAAGARGEDMTTVTGQTYSNIVVQRFDRQAIFIDHDGGSTQIPYTEILPELRGHYKARAVIPISAETMSREKEEPAGPNDLATLSGQIYRNVVVKQVDAETLRIAHDSGMATVYFSAIPQALHQKYRTGMPVVPDPPPGAGDLVTTYGQIFRNIEITRVEPDGLTLRHDGGVTKLWFPALSDELRQKHGYDPVAAWKYQRETAAAKIVVPKEAPPEVPSAPATVVIHGIETKPLPDDNFWIRFAVRNLTDQPQNLRMVPCEKNMAAITSGKMVVIPAKAEAAFQQLVVPQIQPRFLKISVGAYQTNCVLNW